MCWLRLRPPLVLEGEHICAAASGGPPSLAAPAAQKSCTSRAASVVTMLCSALVALLFRANNAVTSPPPITPSAVLDAGAGRSAWLSPDTGSVEVVLSGAFYPLGMPERSPLRVAWSLVLGPTAPVFSDATALRSTATFTTPGTYVLQLNSIVSCIRVLRSFTRLSYSSYAAEHGYQVASHTQLLRCHGDSFVR